MLRNPVSSTRMRSVGWANNTLEIEFLDGVIYQYDNVSQARYQSFINSSSLGSELSRLDKEHSYRRIN